MAVYVDSVRAPVGRTTCCHMIADTRAELFAMSAAIGMRATWVQCAGTYREHFDVSLTRRRHAIALGAQEVTRSRLAALLHRKHSASLAP